MDTDAALLLREVTSPNRRGVQRAVSSITSPVQTLSSRNLTSRTMGGAPARRSSTGSTPQQFMVQSRKFMVLKHAWCRIEVATDSLRIQR